MKRLVPITLLLGVLLMACTDPGATATNGTEVGFISTTTAVLGTSTSTAQPGDVHLLVSSPPERLVVTSPDLTIWGSATPGATISAGGVDTIADQGEFTNDGHPAAGFELTLALQPGRNDITITASGTTGVDATSSTEVTYFPDAVEQFAFLARVSKGEIVVDYAQWLTGEEADEAAVNAGDIQPGDHVPNDYYIVNANDRLRKLALSASTVVVLPTASFGPVIEIAVDLDEWLALFSQGRPWTEGEYPGDDYFGAGAAGTPYWLTIHDGHVVQIHQQYVP